MKGDETGVDDGVPGDHKDEGIASGAPKLTRTTDCVKCSGLGRVPAPQEEGKASYCTHCAGARFVEESVYLRLWLPNGVRNGHTEVYSGEGHVDIVGASPQPNFSTFFYGKSCDLIWHTVQVLDRGALVGRFTIR